MVTRTHNRMRMRSSINSHYIGIFITYHTIFHIYHNIRKVFLLQKYVYYCPLLYIKMIFHTTNEQLSIDFPTFTCTWCIIYRTYTCKKFLMAKYRAPKYFHLLIIKRTRNLQLKVGWVIQGGKTYFLFIFVDM